MYLCLRPKCVDPCLHPMHEYGFTVFPICYLTFSFNLKFQYPLGASMNFQYFCHQVYAVEASDVAVQVRSSVANLFLDILVSEYLLTYFF